jgi:transcriptional regulator with XRE-family HTH domain
MPAYDFAQRLREARQRCGWSQVELGKRSGVHHMAISRLERGEKKDVTGGTLRKLAVALGVTADWLLGIADDTEEKLSPAGVALVSA